MTAQRPRGAWVAFWTFWIGIAALVELAALRDRRRGDTWSEYVAWIVHRAPRVLIPLGVVFLAWFGWHIGVDKGLG